MKYRPSCGTEGLDFMAKFCDRCEYDKDFYETLMAEDGCPIIAKAMTHNVNDPKYPKEWTYKKGSPICTKFKKEKSDE